MVHFRIGLSECAATRNAEERAETRQRYKETQQEAVARNLNIKV
jgi:hypothetical protein